MTTNATLEDNPCFPTHNNLSQTLFHPPVPNDAPLATATAVNGVPVLPVGLLSELAEIGVVYGDSEEEYHPGFQLHHLTLIY